MLLSVQGLSGLFGGDGEGVNAVDRLMPNRQRKYTHSTPALNLYAFKSKMRQNIEENGRDDWI